MDKTYKNELIENQNREPDFQVEATLFGIKLLHYFNPRKEINIIDFGGGCGVITPFIKKLSNQFDINTKTTILDSKKNIEEGMKILYEDKKLVFLDEKNYPLKKY